MYIRTVIFVVWLEYDDLVARIGHRQQGSDHTFRGPAADRNFSLWIIIEAVGSPVFGSDRVAEGLGAPGDWVLVEVRVDGVLRCPLDILRGAEIGKPLGQVDGAAFHRQAGHFTDYRFGELGGPATLETQSPVSDLYRADGGFFG